MPPPAAPVPPRLAPIQWLRGVAVAWVVLLHAVLVARDHAGAAAELVAALPNLWRAGHGGVDLFFVISGFAMAHTMGRHAPAAFLSGRVRRIWPMAMLGTIAFVVLARPALSFDAPTLASTLALVPLLDGSGYHAPWNPVGWTLAFETMFYLLVATILAARRGASTLALACFACAVLGQIVAPPFAPARLILSPLMAEFGFGVLIQIGWRSGRLAPVAPAALAVGLIALGAGVLGLVPVAVDAGPATLANGPGEIGRVLVWGLPWALVTAGALTLRLPPPIARIADAVGDASYSIYLLHLGVIVALGDMLRPSAATLPVFVLSATIGSIGLGCLVHRLVERPLLRAMRPSRARATPVLAVSGTG